MAAPIRSYGLIVFHKTEGHPSGKGPPPEIRYLCAQRRDQIAYVNFFRNQLEPRDLKYYLSLMSQEERDRLLKYPIDELLHDLKIEDSHNDFRKDIPPKGPQGKSSHREFLIHLQKSGELARLISETTSDIKENEWGFPKGRKKYHDEEPLYCALREFYEETRIPLNRLYILDFPPLIENYTGTDGKHYQSIYFVGEAPDIITIKYRSLPGKIRTYTISEEISDLLWKNLSETKEKLTSAKIRLLEFLERYLLSKAGDFRYQAKPFVKVR